MSEILSSLLLSLLLSLQKVCPSENYLVGSRSVKVSLKLIVVSLWRCFQFDLTDVIYLTLQIDLMSPPFHPDFNLIWPRFHPDSTPIRPQLDLTYLTLEIPNRFHPDLTSIWPRFDLPKNLCIQLFVELNELVDNSDNQILRISNQMSNTENYVSSGNEHLEMAFHLKKSADKKKAILMTRVSR